MYTEEATKMLLNMLEDVDIVNDDVADKIYSKLYNDLEKGGVK